MANLSETFDELVWVSTRDLSPSRKVDTDIKLKGLPWTIALRATPKQVVV